MKKYTVLRFNCTDLIIQIVEKIGKNGVIGFKNRTLTDLTRKL
jgi:hypothetical protein